jgi:hypothetical protein
MRIGPKQFAWVAEHGFPNGTLVAHLGPILLAVKLPARWGKTDPDEWHEQLHPAPTPNPNWANRTTEQQGENKP